MNKYDEILDYLWDYVKGKSENAFMTFLDKVNNEENAPLSEMIIKKLNCKYNFQDYFMDEDGIRDLMNKKEENPEEFYECVLAASTWLNLMSKVININIQGHIILNTKDLFRSYIYLFNIGNK